MSRPGKPFDCSWIATNGERLFGHFRQWDGDFAICYRFTYKHRIHKSNLTFEQG